MTNSEDIAKEMLDALQRTNATQIDILSRLSEEFGKNNVQLSRINEQYESVRKTLHEINNAKSTENLLKEQEIEMSRARWRNVSLIFERPKDFIQVGLMLIVILLLLLQFFGIGDTSIVKTIMSGLIK